MRDRNFIAPKPCRTPLSKMNFKFDAPAGPEEINLFSEEFCRYAGVKYAYPVSSYSEAMILAVYALSIPGGSSIAMSAYNFPEIAGAIELSGCRPAFVDIDIHNFTMNMSHFELTLSNNVKAVVASHMFGAPCQIDSVLEAASIYKLFVIEEVGSSLGCVFKGVKAGNFGHISLFNFDQSSLVNCGVGGMIATSSEKVNARLRILMNRGYDSSTGELKIPAPDFSMPPEVARIARENMKYMDDILDYKYAIAKTYKKELVADHDVMIPEPGPFALHTFNYFAAFCKKREVGQKLSKIVQKHAAFKRKVPVFLPGAQYYRTRYSLAADSFRNALAASEGTVFLPNDLDMPLDRADEIARDLKGL